MKLLSTVLAAGFSSYCLANSLLSTVPSEIAARGDYHGPDEYQSGKHRKFAPKVFIIDLYDQEGESWYGIPQFNLLAHNVTVPGLSPIFPDVHCNHDYSICQLIAGEGEVNAAASTTALIFSPLFDLRKTYFLITGVAGIDPRVATTGSVAFARFAVQVGLQYEFDIRDLPNNFTTGYIPQGSLAPDQYPQEIYGTEVFELNKDLLDRAMQMIHAANVKLNDTADAQAYRSLFLKTPRTKSGVNPYAAGAAPPSVLACDSITSDVYFSGTLLNEAFGNYTALVTNGTGRYCAAQQEDNGVLEGLLRGALARRADFSRAILVRTASDFVPPPPGVSDFDNLMYGQAGYAPALRNIPAAGAPVVVGIVRAWDAVFEKGVRPGNYVGDILGSLGGAPDFGPGPALEPEPLTTLPFRRAMPETRSRLSRGSRRGAARRKAALPRMRVKRE